MDQSSTVDTDFIYHEFHKTKHSLLNQCGFSPLLFLLLLLLRLLRLLLFLRFQIYLSFSLSITSHFINSFVIFPARHWLLLWFLFISIFFLLSFSAHCISHKWTHTIHELFISSLGHYVQKSRHHGNIGAHSVVDFLWKIYSLIYLFLFTLLPLKRAICLRCHHCFFHFDSGQLHFPKGTWFRLFLALLWFMENAYYHKIRM